MIGRAGVAVRSVAWLAFLGLSLAALHRSGGALPVAGSGFTSAQDDLARVIVGGGRVVALLMGWYLLLATLVLLGVRLGGWRGVVGTVEALVPRLVRRTVHGVIGLTLVAAPAPALAAPTSPAATVPATAPGEDGTDAITMRRLPDGVPVPAAPHPAQHAAPTGRTWTIAPGDHLWSVAERVLTDHLGKPPTDAAIDPYWRQLIEVNRHRLAHPDVPDLVHPGLVLEVPPPGV